MIMEIVCVILTFVIFAVCSPGSSVIALLLDAPTLLCMLVLCVPVLFRRGIMKDFLRGFRLLRRDYTCKFSELRNTLDVVEMMQKQVLCAACIIALQGIFMAIVSMDELVTLPLNISISLLSVFYAAILEMLLLPLQIEAKRRIVDYMDREEDAV